MSDAPLFHRYQHFRHGHTFLTVWVLKAIGVDADKDVALRPVGDEGLRLQALGTGLVYARCWARGVIEGEKTGLKAIVAAADVIESLPFAGVTTMVGEVEGQSAANQKSVARVAARPSLRHGEQSEHCGRHSELVSRRRRCVRRTPSAILFCRRRYP